MAAAPRAGRAETSRRRIAPPAVIAMMYTPSVVALLTLAMPVGCMGATPGAPDKSVYMDASRPIEERVAACVAGHLYLMPPFQSTVHSIRRL